MGPRRRRAARSRSAACGNATDVYALVAPSIRLRRLGSANVDAAGVPVALERGHACHRQTARVREHVRRPVVTPAPKLGVPAAGVLLHEQQLDERALEHERPLVVVALALDLLER